MCKFMCTIMYIRVMYRTKILYLLIFKVDLTAKYQNIIVNKITSTKFLCYSYLACHVKSCICNIVLQTKINMSSNFNKALNENLSK